MKDIELEAFAGEVNKFVSERLEPVSEKVSELTERLDDIAKQPAPVNGQDGKDGADGAKGDTGEKGADGLGLDIPVYAGGVYREGSVVQANFGQAFRARVDTAEGVDSEDWERIGTHGFRLTGPYSADKTYQPGDLFIKDFGLFLHDGNEAKLIAGRGPEGKKGKQGPAGKDGADGQDGADGKDGSQIEAMEIKDTSLVLVVKDADGEVKSFDTDLAPFLDAAVEVTKSLTEDTTKAQAEEVETQVKNLWNHFQEHLTDQQAIPVRFFRGMWTTALSYQTGDMVKYASSLYVAKRGSTGIMPHGQLSSEINSGDYWAQLTASGGGGGGGDIDLTGYVKRPVVALRDGKWLAYRETTDGKREWSPITTDMVETNGMLMFRDSLGRFEPTPEELGELDTQLKVNRFIWDKIQQLDLKAGGVAISDNPPDDPDNGMFWFDNSEDVMQLYIWHEDSDAWIPVAPPTTLEGRVAAGETTQAAIIAQIQESLEEQAKIKDKVTALEGAVGEHSLIFNLAHTNPRAGDFVIKDDGNYPVHNLSEASIIHISPEDRDGHSIAIDRITEGDVMRLSDIGGVTAELKIKSNLGGGAYGMEKLFGDLDRLSEYPYDFILLSSFDPSGLATKDYVDQRDSTKIGRRAIWTLENDYPWEIRQYDSQNIQRSFIKIHDSQMNLGYVATPTNDRDAATKAYVDQKAGGDCLFRVVEVQKSSELKNGEICFTLSDEKVYISYKTLSGRIWASPVTTDNDLPWPQGIDASSTAGTGRNVPDIFFAYEDPEKNRPMGMAAIRQVSWPRYLDANGNPHDDSDKTYKVNLVYSDRYYSFRTRPPAGTILRVRFAPWL